MTGYSDGKTGGFVCSSVFCLYDMRGGQPLRIHNDCVGEIAAIVGCNDVRASGIGYGDVCIACEANTPKGAKASSTQRDNSS